MSLVSIFPHSRGGTEESERLAERNLGLGDRWVLDTFSLRFSKAMPDDDSGGGLDGGLYGADARFLRGAIGNEQNVVRPQGQILGFPGHDFSQIHRDFSPLAVAGDRAQNF